jgi:hypothetical protein
MADRYTPTANASIGPVLAKAENFRPRLALAGFGNASSKAVRFSLLACA